MKNIEYFFELIQKSDISLLGYRFKQERLKDEIISKLPHLVVPEIDSSFSFKSFLRDLKLQSILETGNTVNNPEYLVLDLNEIIFKSDDLGGRQNQIGNIINKIREDLYSNYSDVYPQTPPYKLLMLTSLYSSVKNVDDASITNFKGGSKPIYVSDVAIVMEEESMKVIKNRFDDNNIDISYNKLKDYNYICNYENNN
jgi:hypothetical protein